MLSVWNSFKDLGGYVIPNGENSGLSYPSSFRYADLENTLSLDTITGVCILATFWALFWHFGYLEMYTIDNFSMMGVLVTPI